MRSEKHQAFFGPRPLYIYSLCIISEVMFFGHHGGLKWHDSRQPLEVPMGVLRFVWWNPILPVVLGISATVGLPAVASGG